MWLLTRLDYHILGRDMEKSDKVKLSQLQFSVDLWPNILQANFDIALKAKFLI